MSLLFMTLLGVSGFLASLKVEAAPLSACPAKDSNEKIHLTVNIPCIVDAKAILGQPGPFVIIYKSPAVTSAPTACDGTTSASNQTSASADTNPSRCFLISATKPTPSCSVVFGQVGDGQEGAYSMNFVVQTAGVQCANSTYRTHINEPVEVVFKAWKSGAPSGLQFVSSYDATNLVEVTQSYPAPFVLNVNVHSADSLPIVDGNPTFTIHFNASDEQGQMVSCCTMVAVLLNHRPQAFQQYNLLRVRAKAAGESSYPLVPVELQGSDADHDVLQYMISQLPTQGDLFQPTLAYLKSYDVRKVAPPMDEGYIGRKIKAGDNVTMRGGESFAVVLYRPIPNAENVYTPDFMSFYVFDGKEKSHTATIPLNVILNTPPQCSNQTVAVTAGVRSLFTINAVKVTDPLEMAWMILLTKPSLGILRTHETPSLTHETPWVEAAEHKILYGFASYITLAKNVDMEDSFQYTAQDQVGEMCLTPCTVTLRVEKDPEEGSAALLDYGEDQNVVQPDADDPFSFTIRTTKNVNKLCVLYVVRSIDSPPIGACLMPTSSGPNFNAFKLLLTLNTRSGTPSQVLVLLNAYRLSTVFPRLMFNLTAAFAAPRKYSVLRVENEALEVSGVSPNVTFVCFQGLPEDNAPGYYVSGLTGTNTCSLSDTLSANAARVTCGGIDVSVLSILKTTKADDTDLCMGQTKAIVTVTCPGEGNNTIKILACDRNQSWIERAIRVSKVGSTSQPTAQQTLIPPTESPAPNPPPVSPTPPPFTPAPNTARPTEEPETTPSPTEASSRNFTKGPSVSPTATATPKTKAPPLTPRPVASDTPTPETPSPKDTIPPASETSTSSNSLIIMILFIIVAGLVMLFWKNITQFVSSLRGTSQGQRRPLFVDFTANDDVPLRDVTSVTTQNHHGIRQEVTKSGENQRAAVISANTDDTGWGDIDWDDDDSKEVKGAKKVAGKIAKE